MDLRETRVVIRPRTPWEAIDLGLRMARQWYWPMLLAWLVIALPAFILMQTLLPYGNWLPLLLFWWFKPWWERLPLYVLSRALFGATPPLSESLKQWPGLVARSPLACLVYRIESRRSLLLPVYILERPRGSKRRQRVRQLCHEDTGPAVWLTLLGVHLESFLTLGCYSLLLLLFPEQFSTSPLGLLSALQAESRFFNDNWLYFASMAVVAPFYVACGFALYLNRRIHLEGWDLEIAFRNLAERRQSETRGGRLALLATAVLLAALSSPAAPVRAAEPGPEFSREQARELIHSTLEGEDFHDIETARIPVLKDGDGFLRWLLDHLKRDGSGGEAQSRNGYSLLAQGMEIMLWTLLFALVALLAWHYRHWLGRFLKQQPLPERPAVTGIGTRDSASPVSGSLPVDVGSTCIHLWQAQRHHEAIALLYRASVQVFSRSRDEAIPASATESDCLELARLELGHDQSRDFQDISRTWIFHAYGQILPSHEAFVQLCQTGFPRWLACFAREETGRRDA